jgi:hypothetical protein
MLSIDREIGTRPLYQRLLGEDWERLPLRMRNMHLAGERLRAEGLFDVTIGNGFFSRLFARAMGIRQSQSGCIARLNIQRQDDREQWSREIGPVRLETIQGMSGDGRLVEQFGSLELLFELRLSASLFYEQSACALRLGRHRIPLPVWLSPRVEAVEMEDNSGAGVKVEIAIYAPLSGLVASYSGCIAPVEEGI